MKWQQKLHIKLRSKSGQAQEVSQGLVTIFISPHLQQLSVLIDSIVHVSFNISTALNGLGEEKNSFKTPRGEHIIRAKVGAGAPLNAIFVARRFLGEIYNLDFKKLYPSRDWILTRILWLSGLELGLNRLGNVDTMQRYIYIHGSPDEQLLGVPSSHGCIRMQNKDIIELFDLVGYGTKVYIGDN